MDPIDMPGPDSTPEAVVAFLCHQLQAMRAAQRTEDEGIAAVSLRLQAEMTRHTEDLRRQFHEAVQGFAQDAGRYRAIRESTVKVRKLGIAAKGLELDELIDKATREAQH